MKPLERLFRRCLLDPDWMCEHVLNSPNDDWQSELMNAVADIDRLALGEKTLFNHNGLTRFSVASCHGPGKTHTAAKLMHWYGFTHKMALIPCTAPKEKQLRTRLWPEFRKLLGGAYKDLNKVVKPDMTTIRWFGNTDWMAFAETAVHAENLAGLHEDHLMFIVDEASGVPEGLYPTIEGALTRPRNILVLIGNPTKLQGEHFKSHNTRGTRELYYRMQVSYKDSPRISRQWAEQMMDKYGPESPVVKVRVLGQWPDADEFQLIPISWVYEARDREFSEDGSLPRKRMTVDVADGGQDQNIITVATLYDTATLVNKQRGFSFPTGRAAGMLCDEVERAWSEFGFSHDRDDIVVDGLGVGSGVVSNLLDAGYPVINYRGSEASDNAAKWRNRRVQSYFVLRDEMRDGRLYLDEDFVSGKEVSGEQKDWDDFLAHVTSVRYRESTAHAEDLEPKASMRKQGLPSPDRADGLAMLYATNAPQLGRSQDIPVSVGTLESEHNDASLA